MRGISRTYKNDLQGESLHTVGTCGDILACGMIKPSKRRCFPGKAPESIFFLNLPFFRRKEIKINVPNASCSLLHCSKSCRTIDLRVSNAP